MLDDRRLLGACVLFGLAGLACTSTVEVRPAAQSLAPTIDTVVGLPISIGWGGDLALRRIQRRASDLLIATTGGRAVIADELLNGEDDAAVATAVQSLGEDPARTLAFKISIGMGGRLVQGASPIPGFLTGNRVVVDYHARIEVRHVGSKQVVGAVETVAAGFPNESEVTGRGRKGAAVEALESAVEKALAQFAPRLSPHQRPFEIVEIPVSAAASVTRRLTFMADLYPELSMDQMQQIAETSERFFVFEAGELAALGVASGDLLGVPGGETKASRAALARALSRGLRPALAIQRGGQQYILAAAAPAPTSTLTAAAAAPDRH